MIGDWSQVRIVFWQVFNLYNHVRRGVKGAVEINPPRIKLLKKQHAVVRCKAKTTARRQVIIPGILINKTGEFGGIQKFCGMLVVFENAGHEIFPRHRSADLERIEIHFLLEACNIVAMFPLEDGLINFPLESCVPSDARLVPAGSAIDTVPIVTHVHRIEINVIDDTGRVGLTKGKGMEADQGLDPTILATKDKHFSLATVEEVMKRGFHDGSATPLLFGLLADALEAGPHVGLVRRLKDVVNGHM